MRRDGGVEDRLQGGTHPSRVETVHQEDGSAMERHPYHLAPGQQLVELRRIEVGDPRFEREERRLRVLRLQTHATIDHFDGVVVDAVDPVLAMQQGPVPLPQADAGGHRRGRLTRLRGR